MAFRMNFGRAALLAIAVLVAAPVVASTAEAAAPGWHQARNHNDHDWRRRDDHNRWERHHERRRHQEWRRHHEDRRYHGMTRDAWRRFGN
ncbi:MAG TPA: hypothetical protein VK597_04740 [Inquilinus sp.]|nr:hypothetical protein [Inquilinus sp.]